MELLFGDIELDYAMKRMCVYILLLWTKVGKQAILPHLCKRFEVTQVLSYDSHPYLQLVPQLGFQMSFQVPTKAYRSNFYGLVSFTFFKMLNVLPMLWSYNCFSRIAFWLVLLKIAFVLKNARGWNKPIEVIFIICCLFLAVP